MSHRVANATFLPLFGRKGDRGKMYSPCPMGVLIDYNTIHSVSLFEKIGIDQNQLPDIGVVIELQLAYHLLPFMYNLH